MKPKKVKGWKGWAVVGSDGVLPHHLSALAIFPNKVDARENRTFADDKVIPVTITPRGEK